MIKKTWKTAFGFSIIIHLLVFTVVAYSELAWSQQEQKQLKEQQRQPIEVELGYYSAAGDTKATPQQTTNSPSSENDQKNRDVSQSNNAVSQDQMFANISPGATADSVGQGVGVSANQKTSGGYSGGGSSVGISSGDSSNGKPYAKSTAGRTAKVAVLYGPTPEYPREARLEGWEGSVRVKVLVSEDGIVRETAVVGSSGHSSIDEAALECLRRWRFSPAYKNGQTVSAWVVVPVVFELR